MKIDINLSAASAYWPRFVLKGKSFRVCSHDEDAVTLSVEAGLAALEVADIPPEKVDGLYLALGASPLAEGPIEQILSNALSLKKSIATATFSGSELASLAALFSAGDAVGAKRLSKVLIIASEGGGSPKGEPPGAGAVALLVDNNGKDPVATIKSFQRDGDVAFHRWRQNLGDRSNVEDNRFLKKYFNEHSTQVLDTFEKDMGKIEYAVFTGAPSKAVRTVLSNAVGGVMASLPYSVDPGDFGVAGPFLGLLTGIEAVGPGENFLAVCHGSGQTVAMSILAGEAKSTRVKTPPKSTVNTYAGTQEVLESKNVRLSLPAASPFFWRNRDCLLRLEAHRCIKCGLVVFPPSERPICRKCHSNQWESYRLPRTGHVYTYCVNNYPPVGFPKPVIHIVGELEDGTRYWAPASEMDAEVIAVGLPVQLVFRRFTQDEGALVYGMKFIQHT